MTNTAPALKWTTVSAGHYTSGPFTIRRDAAASTDNRWSLRRDGKVISAHRLLNSAKSRAAQVDALPTPTNRPTPVEAITAHMIELREWPTASQVVRRGADLDELHHAEARGDVERYMPYGSVAVFRVPAPEPGRPLAVDDVVTVTPHREGRQYDVIALDEIDGVLVRVAPRNPRDVEDAPRWVSAEYTRRVPAALIERVEDDDQADEPTEVRPGPIDRTAILSTRVDSLLHSGAQPSPTRPAVIGSICTDTEPHVRHIIVGTFNEGCPGIPAEDDEQPVAASIEVVPSGKLDGAGLSVAVCSRGDYRSAPATEPQVRKSGEAHLRAVHGAPGGAVRCVEAVAGTGATVHVVLDAAGLVIDGHDVDGCTTPPAPSIADMLRPAMPAQYREYLTLTLRPYGFTVPDGPVNDDPEAFLLHEPTGLALAVHERAVRVSYRALHAGEGDGDLGTAWLDLAYGTSFETVADVVAGLVQKLVERAHLDHHADVADKLRALAEGNTTQGCLMIYPGELTALADRLAPTDTECRAAGYARRATAVLFAVLTSMFDLGQRGGHVEPTALIGLAMNAAEAINAPNPTADDLVEHLTRDRSKTSAAIVADGSADTLVDTLVGAGWQVAPDHEYVAGKRVRYLTPPAATAAGVHPPAEAPPAGRLCTLHGADCRSVQNGRPCSGMTDDREQPNADGEPQPALFDVGPAERPLTPEQVATAECGVSFQTTSRFGHTYYCARPPHGDDAFGHSVLRYPYGTSADDA